MVKFKDFSRPFRFFQVLFKANLIFKDCLIQILFKPVQTLSIFCPKSGLGKSLFPIPSVAPLGHLGSVTWSQESAWRSQQRTWWPERRVQKSPSNLDCLSSQSRCWNSRDKPENQENMTVFIRLGLSPFPNEPEYAINRHLPINLNICTGCSKEWSHWDVSFEYILPKIQSSH